MASENIPLNRYTYLDDFFKITNASQSNQIALDDGNSTVSYSELDIESNRLANILLEYGCKPNERICFMTSKTRIGYQSILAILKTGACFVPLSFDDPINRVLCLLLSIQPKVILVEYQYRLKIEKICRDNNLDIKIIIADERYDEIHASKLTVINGRNAEDLAYIVFTSGSTGSPKGVMVSHRNITQFLNQCFNFFNITESLRFAHCSEFTFDPSIFDIFFCWATGGTLVPMNKRSYRINPLAFFTDKNINVVFTVPSVIQTLLNTVTMENNCLSSIQHLLYTGEALSSEIANQWGENYPQCQQYNFYGTTETAIISHWYKIYPPIAPDSIVPVGFAVPGVKVALLDDEKLVDTGDIGESVVAGAQISKGYWDLQAETNMRFKYVKNHGLFEGKAYFTGDLLVKDMEGCYHYRGRKDRQVKIRGHRIELLEVEKALLSITEVIEAAVLVTENDFQMSQLVGVVYAYKCNHEKVVISDNILSIIKSRLPPYMCPAKIIISSSPLLRSKNGKIDYLKIKKMINGDISE